MTQLVVRIPEEQKQALALEAQRKGETVSDVARRAIAQYTEEKRGRGNRNDLMALLAIAEKGRHIKGPKDLSTNYKRYLYGDKRL
jgi:predicted transcriptional regulator